MGRKERQIARYVIREQEKVKNLAKKENKKADLISKKQTAMEKTKVYTQKCGWAG